MHLLDVRYAALTMKPSSLGTAVMAALGIGAAVTAWLESRGEQSRSMSGSGRNMLPLISINEIGFLALRIAHIDSKEKTREETLLFQGGFTFTNFLADAFAIFMFVLWFWLLIIVAGDLFRRYDISGWAKVLWVILLIVLPYRDFRLSLDTEPGHGRAERRASQRGAERVAPDRGLQRCRRDCEA